MKTFHSAHISVPVVILFSFFDHASSIFCYDCNSAFDPRCGTSFDPFSLGVVNCSLQDPPEHINSTEATLCRTISMEIFGETRVVRKCGYLDPDVPTNTTCRRVTGVGEVFVTYCTCKTDLCNGSSSLHAGQMALFTTFIVFIVFANNYNELA